MEIREFKKEDRQLFLTLNEDFYNSSATMRNYEERISIMTFDHVLDKHENLWGYFLIDADTKETIGYALITSYWCNEEGGNVLVLDELYISPVNRHKGYASLFLIWVENHYRNYATSITLEVLSTNVKACGLYAKEGYNPDGFTTYSKRI